MEYFPAALEKLVEQFARLPGIGSKSAQRLAFFVLSLPEEEAKAFADAIVDAKRTVTFCPVCRNLTDGGLCPICSSPKRDEHVICVVADPRDVVAIERAREYNGRYHVLHGVISPMNHVGPDDLEIKPLLDRVRHRAGEHRRALVAERGRGLSCVPCLRTHSCFVAAAGLSLRDFERAYSMQELAALPAAHSARAQAPARACIWKNTSSRTAFPFRRRSSWAQGACS